MLDAINGVKCTPYTLIANIRCHAEFVRIPEGLADKLEALTTDETALLYAKVYEFWDTEDYSIFSTEKRMAEIGITCAVGV